MKCTVLFLTLSAFTMTAGAAKAAEPPKPYPFKSAIVTYKISGSLQNGSETLYIDDYGRKTRTERSTTMTLMGMAEKDNTLEIDDGKYRYVIDLAEKTGTKMPSASRMAQEMLEKMSPEQKKAMEEIGMEIVKGLSGKEDFKPIGKGKVIGKECEIYEIMGMKTWQWKNLVLKMEGPSLGNMLQEATELKVDCPIPAGSFKPPAGIKIIEVTPPTGPEGGFPNTPPFE